MSNPIELRADLYRYVECSKDLARELAAQRPSRELSLVITKLDEAALWLGTIPAIPIKLKEAA